MGTQKKARLLKFQKHVEQIRILERVLGRKSFKMNVPIRCVESECFVKILYNRRCCCRHIEAVSPSCMQTFMQSWKNPFRISTWLPPSVAATLCPEDRSCFDSLFTSIHGRTLLLAGLGPNSLSGDACAPITPAEFTQLRVAGAPKNAGAPLVASS
jgi:hypothetical protein